MRHRVSFILFLGLSAGALLLTDLPGRIGSVQSVAQEAATEDDDAAVEKDAKEEDAAESDDKEGADSKDDSDVKESSDGKDGDKEGEDDSKSIKLKPKSSAKLKTLRDKTSYVFGIQIGKTIQGAGVDVNLDVLFQAIRDGFEDSELALSQDEMDLVMKEFNRQRDIREQEKAEVMAKKNKDQGDAYLSAHKKVEGIVVTESGLQYRIVKEGEGQNPTGESTVAIHFKESDLDNRMIESTYELKQPPELAMADIKLRGLREALTLMKEGAKWEVWIPSELAYGEKGLRSNNQWIIHPNMVLRFEIELVHVKD